MRCRTCDYALWNIAKRECPECGTPFRPGEFRFRVGAVRFRCPHCRAAYYGTSEEGHLQPATFDCAGCGAAISEDEMVLEPAEGVAEEETGLPPNPWLDRARLGLPRAWFRSVLGVLGAPATFIRAVPARAPLGDAILFAAVTSLAGVAMVLVIAAVVIPVVLAFTTLPAASWWMLVVQFALIVVNVLWVLLGTLAAGFCAHGILILLRGAHGGLDRSLQAILYALGGVSALNLVPCPCSATVMPVWWCVAMTIMLREVHRTSGAKAAIASILGAIVYFAVTIVLAATPGMLGIGSGAPIQFGGTTTAVAAAETPTAPLFADPATAPRMPLDLVVAGTLSPDAFIQLVASGEEERFRLGALDADALRLARPIDIGREADVLAARLPPGDAPFRLGRAIFYYRAATGAPSDWLVVVEPSRRPDGTLRGRYRLIRGSGEERVTISSFEAMFATENRRLVALGRPPLPPPADLTDLLLGSDADPLPPAVQEAPEEEESADDELGAEPDPDPR